VTNVLSRPLAGRVAGRLAGAYPLAFGYHVSQLADELAVAVERANELVAAETGLELPGAAAVLVVTRQEWVDRNLEVFAELLAPAERRLAERLERVGGAVGAAHALARRLLAAETGAVLGLLSRRVLGQYELVLPGGDEGDSIAFVGGNLLAMERAHQFRPSEFRLWVALHEAAHRAQFIGVPWLREYFLSLVAELVDQARPEPGRLRRVVDEMVAARKAGRPVVDERGIWGLLASPGQRDVLDRVQALMSLLEGHGHVVMDRIGSRVLRTSERMSRLLKARRRDPRTAALLRLTGLELKVRQYELGERFVLAVERRGGWASLDRAWEGPEALPTLAEIEDPTRWLRRVA